MDAGGWRPHALALGVYVLLSLAFTWPLPLHLSTHLTGAIDHDAGVYVWNQWIFRHELIEDRSHPYFTDEIFSLTPPANLSLHNYTAFANLVALPLAGWLGVVATFNVVYLALTVLSAYTVFLLARRVTGGATSEPLLAGALFAWSPVLVTRGGGHFSLVAAAPLAVFLLLLLRAQERWRTRDGVLLGIVVAWATASDGYYAVFCLLMAATVGAASVIRVRRSTAVSRAGAIALDILIACAAGLVAALAIGPGWRVTLLGVSISMRGLHTPVLVLTMLVLVRAAIRYRPHIARVEWRHAFRLLRVACVAGLTAAALLSPMLYALGRRVVEGRFETPLIFWRSSPRGADVAALLLPNPNHPLAPASIREWIAALPEGYLENVASVPLVALAIVALALRAGWRIPRLWGVLAAVFLLLLLGPFVHVAGVNTYLPGPWALLRYVPVVGLARAPTRFIVVFMLALAVIVALALRALAERHPRRRAVLVTGAAVLLAAELLPSPRPLHAAMPPAIYARIAADARGDVRVLELPFGLRDGTMSVGDFTARTQFYQTHHGKPILGGYLSRVSPQRVADHRRLPVLQALLTLSEGGALPDEELAQLVERGPAFVERARLAWVVIDRSRASEKLVRVATAVLGLERVARDGSLELYRPVL